MRNVSLEMYYFVLSDGALISETSKMALNAFSDTTLHINQTYHALRSSSESMDSKVAGIALILGGAAPTEIVPFLPPRNP